MRISKTTGIKYKRNPIPLSIKKEVLEKCGFRCVFCKVNFRIYPNLFTIDHILAKYLGGDDKIENLMSSCVTCNSSRGGYSLDDSVEYLFNRRNKNPYMWKNRVKISNKNNWILSL